MEIVFRYKKVQELEYVLKVKSEATKYLESLINLSLGVEFSKEESTINIILLVKYMDKSNNDVLLEFKTKHYFEIKDFEKTITVTEDGRLTLGDNFLFEILGLSVGTTRGMLIVRNSGTPLSEVLLPNFNLKELIEKIKSESAQL